jgi:eukaryotic-like serine/threonine-protein kinase
MADEFIAGRYRLGRRLGMGGMSTVRLAFDTNLEREVAVKLLAEHLADDDNFVSRFRREALAAARLVHPNIVQVFDFGLDEATGQHYIVMEYVSGRSCAEILRERKLLPVDEVLDIISQSCRGLDHAHRNGVVHRDVKPGNLMKSDDGVVKLADFGIAKATEQSSITQVGSVLGTAAYLAPEQARGEEAGPPADQYALGVVTYQMLAGRLPYEATSLTELAFKQQREMPPQLHELNPDVPAALAHAVARSMALDVAARFPSALAMGEALRNGADGIEPPPAATGAHEATAATEMLAGTAATELAETDATRAIPRRRPVEPRPAAPRPPTPATTPEQARALRRAGERQRGQRRSGRVLRRLILVLALIAVIVVGAVILSDSLSGNPQLRRVTEQNLQQAVDQVKQFVNDNTK